MSGTSLKHILCSQNLHGNGLDMLCYSDSHRSKLQSFAHLLLLYIEKFTHEGHRTSKPEMQSEFHEMGKALWEEIGELIDTMPPFNLCSVVQEPFWVYP